MYSDHFAEKLGRICLSMNFSVCRECNKGRENDVQNEKTKINKRFEHKFFVVVYLFVVWKTGFKLNYSIFGSKENLLLYRKNMKWMNDRVTGVIVYVNGNGKYLH